MTTQRHEIEAWLGDDHGLTSDQIDQLVDISDNIQDRYPDPDDEPERQAALAAAYELLRGNDHVVEELARKRTAARLAELEALAALRQAALMLVGDQGEPEATFARRAGVDRMNVRKWLGKRPERGAVIYDWVLASYTYGETPGMVRAKDDEEAMELALAAAKARRVTSPDEEAQQLTVRRRGRNTGAGNWVQYDAETVYVADKEG